MAGGYQRQKIAVTATDGEWLKDRRRDRNLSDGDGAAESRQLEQLFHGERVFVDKLLKQLAWLRLATLTHTATAHINFSRRNHRPVND